MEGEREYILSSTELLGPLKDFLEDRGYGVYAYLGMGCGSIHTSGQCHTPGSCGRVSKFTWEGEDLKSSHKVTLGVKDSGLIEVIDSYLAELE